MSKNHRFFDDVIDGWRHIPSIILAKTSDIKNLKILFLLIIYNLVTQIGYSGYRLTFFFSSYSWAIKKALKSLQQNKTSNFSFFKSIHNIRSHQNFKNSVGQKKIGKI